MNVSHCLFSLDARSDMYVCEKCGFTYTAKLGIIRHVCQLEKGLSPGCFVQVTCDGPGDHLHRLIRDYTGEDYKTGCGCESMVRQMNVWGVDGCRKHLEEIVDKMHDEAVKRGWKTGLLASVPIASRMGMKALVHRAIHLAEKEMKDAENGSE